MSPDCHRRKLLTSAGVLLVLAPFATLPRKAEAATNPALREQFKYQSGPMEGKSCISCLEFVPGKTEKDLGGCRRIPGDDQIAPDGYCLLWNTL